MNLNRLFNFPVSPASNQTPESNGQNPKRDSLNPEIDFFAEAIHELNVQELGYGKLSLLEEYKTALKVAEQYEKINGIKEQIAFWDAHPKVFGIASVVVFDIYEEKYWGHHGQYRYSSIIGDLVSEDDYKIGISKVGLALDNINPGEEIIKGRYKVVWICPADTTEFWPFVDWCIQKCRVKDDYTIMDKEYYWGEMKDNLFPETFLTRLLEFSEKFYHSVNGLNAISPDICSEALAKEYFFFYGTRDASVGYNHTKGVFETASSLFTVFYSILVCPLSIYGEIFFQYFNGCRTAEMVAFLKKQKKRLNKGDDEEVLRRPATDESHQTQAPEINETQTLKATLQPVIGGQSPQVSTLFIKIGRRHIVIRQLSIELDEDNKARLIKLIDMDPPTEKVYIKVQAKVLADYFRQVYNAMDIDNTDYSKDYVGDWLAHWFVRPNGKPFKPGTFKDYLHMKDDNPMLRRLKGKIKYPKA